MNPRLSPSPFLRRTTGGNEFSTLLQRNGITLKIEMRFSIPTFQLQTIRLTLNQGVTQFTAKLLKEPVI